MKSIIKRYPIAICVFATLLVELAFSLVHDMIPASFSDLQWLYADSALRFLFAIPCILLIGAVLNQNGLRFAFATKGFTKGLFASIAIILFSFTMLFQFFIAAEINTAYIPRIPGILLQQITTGLFEEAWFRGLLMIGMLMKWSDTVIGRIASVLLSGILFGLAHVTPILSGGDVQSTLMSALGATLLGFGYAAIFIYSKNLLCCMFIHAYYDIAVHLSNGLISSVYGGTLHTIIRTAQPVLLYAVIPVFAIMMAIKAKPFELAVLSSVPDCNTR